MTKKYNVAEAILSLNPQAGVKVVDNDFNQIDWGATTPLNETDVDSAGLAVRRSELIEEAKLECNRRIIEQYPYYKQHNILRADSLTNDYTATTAMDSDINALITKCDGIEAEIITKTIDELDNYDVTLESKWI